MKTGRTFSLPPILIKVGKKEHIEQFVNDGLLKFGTYAKYRKQEEDEKKRICDKIIKGEILLDSDFDLIRRDPLEGLEKQLDVEVKLKLLGKSIAIPNAKLNIYQSRFSHLLCMFGFSRKIPFNFKIDRRMREFGDTAVIFNSKIFLESLAKVLNSTNYDMRYVNYYPETTFFKNLGPFSKLNLFAYQYEYRVSANLKDDFVNIGPVLSKRKDTILLPSVDLDRIEYDIR